MSDIRPTLRSELESTTTNVQALEAQISSAQERLRAEIDKVERIRALLAIYEAEAEAAKPTVPMLPVRAVLPPTPPRLATTQRGAHQRVSKKTQMENEVAAFLALRGSVHRVQIVEHLSKLGIMGKEKDPLAHLAAFLSDHKVQFMSDGKGVFSLRPNVTQPASSPPEEPQPKSDEVTGADAAVAS